MKNLILTIAVFTFCTPMLSAQNLDVDLEPYGQASRSIGLSLFGQGLVGMPFRFINASSGNQFEIVPSISGRTITDDEFEDFEFDPGINIGLGYNILLGQRYKQHKYKVIKNYIGVKAGALVVDDPSGSIGLTWHREAFFKDDFMKSRGLDLGLVYSYAFDGVYANTNTSGVMQVFFRIDWNWYRK